MAKEKLSNHIKTTLIEATGLGRDISIFEKILLSCGMGLVVSLMERVRVYRTINSTPGMSAKPVDESRYGSGRFDNTDFN